MDISLLNELIIIFSLSIVVFLVFSHFFKMPTVLGFLLTGILVGPHGIGLIKSVHEVEALAEIGIILLLFTIGIEFSFQEFIKMKRTVLIGGALQVGLTILGVVVILSLFNQPMNQSVFIGFLVSLSSTAIVLKILQDRAEIDSPHGKTTLGILIFQDIAVIPMILITPLIAGVQGATGISFIITIAKAVGIILIVIVSAKWLVPRIFYQITKTKNRELFLLSVIVICFSVAWLTSKAGLSLALGAFIAGLVISESDYNHQALGNILPFKDIFTSIFFISIGMLLNMQIFIQSPILIIAIAFIVIILKAFTACLATILLGFPLRTSILVGFKLLQIGEFAFVLSKFGIDYGLINENMYQIFLAVSILTMGVTPFFISNAQKFVDIILKLPLPQKLKIGYHSKKFANKKHKVNHTIIIGFGINGKNLARASKAANIDYIAIESNPQIVRSERHEGEPIFHGDATHEVVLKFAGVSEAKIVVIAISDVHATRRIVSTVRRINPDVNIIARTRYFKEVNSLLRIGANEVIPEEFETSIEIFTRVLEKYLIPRNEIEKFIEEIRADNYIMFRTLSNNPSKSYDLRQYLPEIQIKTFRVNEKSDIAGKTLSDIDLRRKYNVALLSIQRESDFIALPDGSIQLQPNDIVIVAGHIEKLNNFANIL